MPWGLFVDNNNLGEYQYLPIRAQGKQSPMQVNSKAPRPLAMANNGTEAETTCSTDGWTILNGAHNQLFPSAWHTARKHDGDIFNPAITCYRGELLMIYRVVMSDGLRRLAACRLMPDFHVVPHSVVPFSDLIEKGGDWHADARFCTFRDRLFVHYNDGSLRGRRGGNHIYILEVDPATLKPKGRALELVLEGPRRTIEKNWMLFEHAGELWAVYSISPHQLLNLDLSASDNVLCRPAHSVAWDTTAYASRYGCPRGGTPPVLFGDYFVSFFHSSYVVRPWRHRMFRLLRTSPKQTIRYVAGVYAFSATPPFTPLWMHPQPVIHPPPLPRQHVPQLDSRIERSVYPCGSVFQNGRWIVSCGVQEEFGCLTTLDAAVLHRQSNNLYE